MKLRFVAAAAAAIAALAACNPLTSNSKIDTNFVAGTGTPAPTPAPTPVPTATPPQGASLAVQSASIDASGSTIVVTVIDNGFGPVLPSTGVTGFTVIADGTPVTVSSANRTGNFEITLTLASPIASDNVAQLNYSSGNVTDSSTLIDVLQDATPVATTNNAAYEKIVLAYNAAVVTNGGTLSTATKTATQNFVNALKAAGVWTKLIEIYPFAGSNLAAALTKLKKKTGTPSALSSGVFDNTDYVETGATGGLRGRLTSTPLDTGLSIPSLTQNSLSIGAYVNLDSSGGAAISCYIGSSYNASGNNDRFYMMGHGGNTAVNGQSGLGAYCPANMADGTGFRLMNYDGTNITTYRSTIATTNGQPGLVWQQVGNVTLFNCAGNFPYDGRLALGFVGQSLTPTEAAAFEAAAQAFETALGRNI